MINLNPNPTFTRVVHYHKDWTSKLAIFLFRSGNRKICGLFFKTS